MSCHKRPAEHKVTGNRVICKSCHQARLNAVKNKTKL